MGLARTQSPGDRRGLRQLAAAAAAPPALRPTRSPRPGSVRVVLAKPRALR